MPEPVSEPVPEPVSEPAAATRAPVTRFAPAKLNLYLQVTGRREDGFHELDSLVAFADVGDVITVEDGAHKGLSLTVTGPFADQLGNGDDNLVLRAARLLAERTGVPADAHITLEKNLPVASGIGGGSADAAATLKALVEFWRIELADDDLHHVAHSVADNIDTARTLATLFKLWRDDLGSEMLGALALELGADVPVCLESRPLFMGGIGERLELPPDLPPVWLVLVNPGVAVPTPKVFHAFKAHREKTQSAFSQPARFSQPPRDATHLAEILQARSNDLSAPAIEIAPVIADALEALEAQKGSLLARMSGSGATCFALFATEKAAHRAAKALQKAQPGWWVVATKLLDTPLDF